MDSTSQQLSGQDPLRRRRDHDRHECVDRALDSATHVLNGPEVNSRAVPVSLPAEASGGQPTRHRHQPLPPLNLSPTNEKSLALAAAIAQANGLVLQPDPNRPSLSHRSDSPIAPTTHSHINPAEYPSPPASDHSSPYPSGVSVAIQEALDSLHPPQFSPQQLRVVGGSPFTVPASLPTTPLLIASFPTTPSAVTQSIHSTGTPGHPYPMPIPAGQSPYLEDRHVTGGVASNMDPYPQRRASPSSEPKDDEGFQMDLDEEFAVPDYPEDDIVQIEPLEVYQPPSSPSMLPSPMTIASSRPPTQPLATKSSKGHHLELDISGLARRFTYSSQRSSAKSLPPSNVPSAASASADSPSNALDSSTHTNTGGSSISPHRFLRKPQSQSRLRDASASGTSSVSSQSSLNWISGNSVGSGASSRLPGLPRRQKSFQNSHPPPVPVPTISSSLPGLRHAGSFNHSTASAQSGSPPEDKSKGKEKVEKEKVSSPRKRFFNSNKYSSGNSLVLEKEYAGLIGKVHEADASPLTQYHHPSLKLETPSPVNTHGPPLPHHPQYSRPRTAPPPQQRVSNPPPSKRPPSASPAPTSPLNGQPAMLEDEWASHFSSPLTISGLFIREAAGPFTLASGTAPGVSPPLLKQGSEGDTSPSTRESPRMSVWSFKAEEQRPAGGPRQHIIPPSELLRLGEEAREHTGALHAPPSSLSRARSTGASFEYPAMSGFAPNGTPVGFAALRARSTSTSRLPSDSAALASPILGPQRIRSQRAGSTGTNMTVPMLARPLGAYASANGSISSPSIDLGGGGAPTRSLSVLSKTSSLQSSPAAAAKARRPSTAGSLQISTPLSPIVGFVCPNANGGLQSLPPPPRPRLPSLRTGGSIAHGAYGPGHSSSARTSTSTEFVSPISTLTSAPTRSSGASWARTTSSPNVSRPPSSASLSHPPVHSPGVGAGVGAGASQRQRSVLKKPSFLVFGDDDDDGRINVPEGEISAAGGPRISRTNTNATSRTNSSLSSSGGRSRAPSSASVGRSVHKVPSRASLRGAQPPVSVVQSDSSFLELDIGSVAMDTIRQHPDELELGESERVLGYRF